jgi:preprotein translocase subunit YajC
MNKIFYSMVLLLTAGSVFADEVAASPMGGSLNSMLMFGMIFVVMYFVTIRPQSKKAKEHKLLLASIAKGDEVITLSGILGTIVRESNNYFVLNVGGASEMFIQKNSIAQMLPKGTLKSI